MKHPYQIAIATVPPASHTRSPFSISTALTNVVVHALYFFKQLLNDSELFDSCSNFSARTHSRAALETSGSHITVAETPTVDQAENRSADAVEGPAGLPILRNVNSVCMTVRRY